MNHRHGIAWSLRTRVAFSALALVCSPAVVASEATGPVAPERLDLAQSGPTYAFDIDAKPLPKAIADFSAVTGMQVLYTEPSTFQHAAPALRGTYTAEEALQRLLAQSGLAGRRTSENSMTIERIASDQRGSTTVLAPIQVYGAKNATTLNDTAASVGVVTSEEIERMEIGSFRGAFRTMGNVLDADWPDGGFLIRGVNSEGLTPGGQPLASLYIDGTPQTQDGARRGARGLWDVEQVEVYRGPQSTLTGRAALAGAVYIKTKDPSFDWENEVSATVGSMKTKEGAFMVGGPLIDEQLAFRMAAEYHVSENDINYPTYTGFARYQEFIEDEYYQVRGKLLYLPAGLPSTSALFTYSISHDSPHIDDIGGPVLGFDYSERRGDFNAAVFSESRSVDTHNLSLEIKHDLTPSLVATSLTTYAYSDLERPSINEGTPGQSDFLRGGGVRYIISQELRANYEAGAWMGVAGFYGAKEKSDLRTSRPNFFNFASDISKNTEDLYNVAAFGETTYEFIPTWKVVAGGRADYTEQEATSFFSRNGTATTDQSSSFDEFVFLPKAGLTKDLSPDQTVAFTVQRGFRNGGSGAQRSTGATFTFDPEFVWNYELSYKGTFLQNRLRLSANAFYMDWKDQQVEVQSDPADTGSIVTTNAASSSIKGFEVEGNFKATRELSTFASIGYVDTEFEQFNDASLGNLSGFPFPEAPEWNAAAGAHYQTQSGYFVGVDGKYVSEYLARFGQAPQEYLDGYFIANVQAGYKAEAWDVTVFAENVLDKEYFVFNDRNAAGDIAATEGRGRLIGVTFKARF